MLSIDIVSPFHSIIFNSNAVYNIVSDVLQLLTLFAIVFTAICASNIICHKLSIFEIAN